MSTSFSWLNPQFDCEASGLLADDCYTYVCSLPPTEWAGFVTHEANNFRSLANEFGAYYCDDEIYLNIYASAPFLGSMIGCIIMALWADNHGRKNTLRLAGIVVFVGSVILIFAVDLWMAVIGLLLCGIGSDAALTLFTSMGAEWYEDNHRQKVGSLVQTTYIVGALAVTLFYYLFEDWRVTTLYCLIIPSSINAILIFLFVKESPMYLIIQSQ